MVAVDAPGVAVALEDRRFQKAVGGFRAIAGDPDGVVADRGPGDVALRLGAESMLTTEPPCKRS